MKKQNPTVEKLNLVVARKTLKRAIKNGEWKNAERIQRMIKTGSSRTLDSGRNNV
jgi:hypothetical protein